MALEEFPAFNTEPDPVVPLLQKLLEGEPLSGEETQLLEEWKSRSEANQALIARLGEPEAVKEMLRKWHGVEKSREQNKLRGMNRVSELAAAAGPVPRVHFLRNKFFRYAAAVLILLGSGVYLVTLKTRNHPLAGGIKPAATEVITPGREGAVLTLADGSQVVLDSLANGLVASQGGAQVVLQNGQLAYDPSGNTGEVAWNTVSTPKGRQFRLQLPDGSKIWLNAASSVKYPTVFTGGERKVELEGEAYFEVTENAEQPFKVSLRNAAAVEVLGTSFNVNAYHNESAIKTTLVDGAVKMNAFSRSQVLKPGQQAVAKLSKEELELVRNADLDKVMAWKNGLFNFDDASLEEVMRQLERWYDIEVVYTKGIPAARFGGEINKQNTLQDVLQILEKSNVHFRLEEGRRLVVVP